VTIAVVSDEGTVTITALPEPPIISPLLIAGFLAARRRRGGRAPHCSRKLD